MAFVDQIPNVLAGRLRQRVQIQSKNNQRDAHGGYTEIYQIDATVWAGIHPISAKELFASQQVDGRVTHRIIIRFFDGLTPDMRFVEVLGEASRVFNIISIRNIDERDRSMEVLTQEVTDTTGS